MWMTRAFCIRSPYEATPVGSWHGPFVHWRAGVRVLDVTPSHLMQRRDALEPALLQTAHHVDLPGGAGATGSNPRVDDTEVTVTVLGVHAPGVQPGCGGWQQDLTGQPIRRVIDAAPG